MEEVENEQQTVSSSMEAYEDLDWDGLLYVCKEKEEQLNLAGACGLKLHEQLIETQMYIDEMRMQHEAEMEKMVQEMFELRNKLEVKEKSLFAQQQEFENFQKHLVKKFKEDEEELQNQHKRELNAIKKTNEALNSSLEQVKLNESQTKKCIEQLNEKINELQTTNQQQRQISNTNHNDLQLCEIQEKYYLLKEALEKKETIIRDFENNNQSLKLVLQTKEKEIDSLRKEMEEAEIQSTSYFNHLQRTRKESSQLQAELDTLRAEMKSSGHFQSGNSLFAEVEDKRIEMEKKLLSMKVKHESLQKSYNFVKSQLLSMKTQVSALLQMNAGKADGERISHLERALSQAKSETLELAKKLKEAEDSHVFSSDDLVNLAKDLPQFQSNKDVINFLSIQLKDQKKAVLKLREELDHTYMVKLAESDKLQVAEQKLHESGVLAEKYKSENMKLRLNLEETKNKLLAETHKRQLIEKKFNYDSSDDIALVGVLNDQQFGKSHNDLPYTLAKAKEKSTEKTHQKNEANDRKKNPDASFQWNLLPTEVLKELGIDKNKLSLNKEAVADSKSTSLHIGKDIENILSPINTKDQRLRRVSFKDETETIPSSPKKINQQPTTIDEISNEDDTKELKENLSDVFPKIAQKSFPREKKSISHNEEDCKLQ